MRKLISIIIVLALAHHVSFAQDKTFETRVADVLTEMPTSNLEILNKQMGEMISLGEQGILKFAEMLSSPTIGGDVKVRYALGNLSKFISSGKNENTRLMVSNAYLKALETQPDDEIKFFLIKQLQLVGKDEAVDLLSTYLTNDRLCGVATMALTTIGTKEAGEALFKYLPGLKGNNQVNVVKGLGTLKVASAEKAISEFAASKDVNLKKVSLYYLANLPTLQFGKSLEAAAKSAGYTFEETRANASYLLYTERLAQIGQLSKSEKICKKLISQAPEHTAGQALSLLVKYNSKLANKYVVNALSSDSKKYRETALSLAVNIPGTEYTTSWFGIMPKYPANVQAEIITMLGNRGDKAASAELLTLLTRNETTIQLAAIQSLAKLDPQNAVDPFIGLFPSANDEVLKCLMQTMLWIKSENVITEVAQAIPQNTGNAKVTLIDILAAKKAFEFKAVIYNEIENSDDRVKLAALNALEAVSEKSDQQKLFDLFSSATDSEELKAIQQALLAVAVQLETTDEKISFMKASENLSADKVGLFLEILPDLGGEEALSAVIKNFNSDNNKLKNSAFTALTNWNGLAATGMLYKIATSMKEAELNEKAAMAYLRQVNTSQAPDAQKLLLIRKIVEETNSVDVKRTAINSVGRIKSISALLVARAYLGDKALQQDVARAIMNISLPGNGNKTGLSGEIVKESLLSVIQLIKGAESDYDKAKIQKYLDEMSDEPGFVSVFNGNDLTGWKGLVENPIARSKMSEKELAKKQAKADKEMVQFWSVKDGVLWFNGKGHNLCTEKKYGDFEMLVDWRISRHGDSGLYLRGTPQVQVWDTSRVEVGAQVGSGGLYNNKKNRSTPLVVADNPIDEWNNFHVIMIGERVTVYLNGLLVVDDVVLENYWDRSQPIFAVEQIELQAHGNELGFRDIYIKEITKSGSSKLSEKEVSQGFMQLFDGSNLYHWTGNKTDYVIEKDELVIYPKKGGHGNLFTAKEYADFNFRFDFLLTPGANNGLGIRAPLEGDAAYVGTELQILDNTADIYKDLQAYQYHGSAYGIIAAKRGFLKPVGEWNSQEVIVKGNHIKVILNGTVILDGDMKEESKNGAKDGKKHPGLDRSKGHIGFLGHGSVVRFRNIRIKEL
jgi:HEAT repeat protein